MSTIFINFLLFHQTIALQKLCMTRPTLIDLNSDKYTQGLHYYPFVVNLDRSNGSCNTLDDPSNKYVFQTKQKI